MYLLHIVIYNMHLLRRSFSFVATNKWLFQLLFRSNSLPTINQKMYCSCGSNITANLFFYKALAPKRL